MESYEDRRRNDRARERLGDAFKALRKRGMIARRRFSCCNGCAGYEIACSVEEKFDRDPERARRITGAVFYSRQADFQGPRGKIYLHFGAIDTTKHGEIGLPDEEVGRMICEELKTAQLRYEWSGDTTESILVFAEPVEVER